jgi:hypothetical protein
MILVAESCSECVRKCVCERAEREVAPSVTGVRRTSKNPIEEIPARYENRARCLGALRRFGQGGVEACRMPSDEPRGGFAEEFGTRGPTRIRAV